MTSGTCTWGGWWDGKGRRSNHPTTGGWQDAKKRGKKSGLLVHLQQDPAGTPYLSGGGGVDEVSGGVHLDVGVLRLPHRVSPHRVEELVNSGGERG